MIIDFHAHTFPEKISSKVVKKLGMAAHILAYTDGSIDGLTASMERAGVDYSVNLPVMTSPDLSSTFVRAKADAGRSSKNFFFARR